DNASSKNDSEVTSTSHSPCEASCDTSTSIPNELSNEPVIVSSIRSRQTVATQTGHESPDMMFNPEKMTVDEHCYECKVRYRDPKPQDLIMYLHAWSYKGPGWEYKTPLPEWAKIEWTHASSDMQNNS
ncbi:hypothetical protein HHI36_005745, partial [Cryptolaemus montrouzieri]